MGSVDGGCRNLENDTLACGGAVGKLQKVPGIEGHERMAYREVVGGCKVPLMGAMHVAYTSYKACVPVIVKIKFSKIFFTTTTTPHPI